MAVSTLIFVILYYFVGNQDKLKRDIEHKNIVLNEQSEKLKQLDEMKSHFFANISHEFRTPLTLILGLVNKQISNPKTIPDPQDSDKIKRNSNRLLQLINQLLDLSKLESGEMGLESSAQDFSGFAKNITSLFESMADENKIKLSFNGQPVISENTYDEIEIYFDHEKNAAGFDQSDFKCYKVHAKRWYDRSKRAGSKT